MALLIKRVSSTDVPATNHKGRKRQPTDFDEFMVIYNVEDFTDADGNVSWDGWNEVEADSETHLSKLINELVKASNHFDVGLEKRTDVMALRLWFRIKPRAHKPRSKSEDATVSELPTGDQEADQSMPKRARKAS